MSRLTDPSRPVRRCRHCGFEVDAPEIEAHEEECSDPKGFAYYLDLTPEDVSTIAFVGHRYAWAEALSSMDEGRNRLQEHEAWELRDAFEEDTEGGHSFFPCLSHESDLARKLFALMDEII